MNNFRKYRQSLRMSQKAVGEYLGITGQAYSNYENEKRQADYDTLIRLSRLFGASIEELLAAGDRAGGVSPEESELREVMEQYQSNAGMRLLFSLTKDASPEDIIEAASIIERQKNGKVSAGS